tara:strand:+ start:22256 stop:23386 length:1131 start_codon:yes stop_codon:yes gene_type:complete
LEEFDLVFVISNFEFFKSHRRSLILFLSNSNKKIALITNLSGADQQDIKQLKEKNISLFDYQLNRSSIGIVTNILDIFSLYKILSKIKFRKLTLISSKPIVLGSFCSLFLKIDKIFIIISGLGYAFISKSLKAKSIKLIVLMIYKVIFFKKNIKVVFQNEDDLNYFLSKRIVSKNKTKVIRGNGLDTSKFKRKEYPEKLTFLFASRLLIDKGIKEYIEAATSISNENASFIIAGDIDEENPNSLKAIELNKIQELSGIEYMGKVPYADMQELFNKAHIFVLPSYREGLPQAALEAGACSMPLIVTDVNGCRDCIINGETGFLVNLKDAQDIKEKMNFFIKNTHIIEKMGAKSREYINDRFSEDKIHKQFLSMYQED